MSGILCSEVPPMNWRTARISFWLQGRSKMLAEQLRHTWKGPRWRDKLKCAWLSQVTPSQEKYWRLKKAKLKAYVKEESPRYINSPPKNMQLTGLSGYPSFYFTFPLSFLGLWWTTFTPVFLRSKQSRVTQHSSWSRSLSLLLLLRSCLSKT